MSSEQCSRRPAHLQLRDALARRIAAGEWGIGKQLPSAKALAREFGVSCSTVRTALDILEREDAIVRKQGQDAFVTRRRSELLASVCGNSTAVDEITIAGRNCALTLGWANDIECERLRLHATDPVYRGRLTRTSNGKAFMAERATLPAALFPGLGEKAFLVHRIVDLAEAYGMLLGRAEERVAMGNASSLAAEALGLCEGSPVLILDRIVMTRDGRPAEWRVGECCLTEEHLSSIAQMGGKFV